MVPDQTPNHYWNPVLSEWDGERFSLRPAAHLFEVPWQLFSEQVMFREEKKCNIWKGQARNMQKPKASAAGKIQRVAW